jgi:Putative transposase/Transposase zinc-binding domain
MLELADIVRAVGPQERARLALLPSQQRALQAIVQCRTAALGGDLYQCTHCGRLHYSYHSCGNRHCPKCHGQQTQAWLQRESRRLLPCAYDLVTFTVPAELRALARSRHKLFYGLLLKCAAASLQKLCRDPQWLGAQPSLLGVLHTWTRALLYHPHAHFLVSAGGLSADGQQWVEPKNAAFLVPVQALSRIFRAKLRRALKDQNLLSAVPREAWTKDWVVHIQHAGRGEKVLGYLARYVFRIALSNSRLERFENGQVTFRYRDNRTQQLRRVCLPAVEFLRRFLDHVLPKGFAKVRHYGLASTNNQARQAQALVLLEKLQAAGTPSSQPSAPSTPTPAATQPLRRCPYCGIGQLEWADEIRRPLIPP